MTDSKKYTLSLPEPLYEELRAQADKHDRSIREVVRQCLKFGLIGMKIEEDPLTDLLLREEVQKDSENGALSTETKETYIQFIW